LSIDEENRGLAVTTPSAARRDVENSINAMLGEIVAAMARSDRVELRGFGAFSARIQSPRTGRNPLVLMTLASA